MNNKNSINYIKLFLRTKEIKRSNKEIKSTTAVTKLSLKNYKFQMSGLLLFTGVQKLYRPEISRFLPCVLPVLPNLRELLIFSNYIGETDHFMLDILKRSDN